MSVTCFSIAAAFTSTCVISSSKSFIAILIDSLISKASIANSSNDLLAANVSKADFAISVLVTDISSSAEAILSDRCCVLPASCTISVQDASNSDDRRELASIDCSNPLITSFSANIVVLIATETLPNSFCIGISTSIVKSPFSAIFERF